MTDSTREIEEIRERKRRELVDDESGGTERTPEEPIQIRGEEHLGEVTSEYDVVLVDFYADWCGPCRMMEPAIEDVARESNAAVAKVDIDEQQVLAQQYGVRSVPTLVLFRDGEPEGQLVGAQDKETLLEVVERYTAN